MFNPNRHHVSFDTCNGKILNQPTDPWTFSFSTHKVSEIGSPHFITFVDDSPKTDLCVNSVMFTQSRMKNNTEILYAID